MPAGIASIRNAAVRPFCVDSTDPISVIRWTSMRAMKIAAVQMVSTPDWGRNRDSAARLIERMESEGLVSRPDHVGRREVLIDAEGHAI